MAGRKEPSTRELLSRNRAMPSVSPPIWDEMDSRVLFPADDGSKDQLPIDLASLKVHLAEEGRLKLSDALHIIGEAAQLLAEEPNLLTLEEPITVVGDLHGQYYDLVKLLEIGGEPEGENGTTYLFLGDYVDRGCFSCEIVLLLFAMKICYPDRVFLLRGNHEARHLTTYFNFKAECLHKYTAEFYSGVINAFDALPLASMVGTRFFCVHGGLSPDVLHIQDIAHIHRFREVPNQGPMCDLLWSDPQPDVEGPLTGNLGHFEQEPVFTSNELRNCSYVFNYGSLHHFITQNQILCVIRAHEAQDEGYKLYRSHPATQFPSMLTIFSAPNYCDTYDNKGAIAVLNNGTINLKQYFSSPHPYVLPNFMSGFVWSLPFVEDRVGDALESIMGRISAAEEAEVQAELKAIRERSRRGTTTRVEVVNTTEAPAKPPAGGQGSPNHDGVGSRVRSLGRMALAMERTNSNPSTD